MIHGRFIELDSHVDKKGFMNLNISEVCISSYPQMEYPRTKDLMEIISIPTLRYIDLGALKIQ